MKYILLLVTAIASCGSTFTQPLFTQLQAKDDVGILRRALETMYPSMYRYNDSVTVNNYFDEQFRSIGQNETTLSVYSRVVEICAKMRDEHLIPRPPSWYYDSLKNKRHFFPFSIKLIHRRMYVLRGHRLPANFPVGSEILSINGKSVEDILTKLMPTIPGDGYVQTFRMRHLEDYAMTQNENLFDLNYPIFVENADTFRITYTRPASRNIIESVALDGIGYSQYQTFYKERRIWSAPLHFKYLSDSAAYLRISSFHKGHRDAFHQDFQQLYDSIFSDLRSKRTKNLVLDLRGNEGGDDMGYLLLNHLMTKPYRMIDYLEEKFTGYPAVAEHLENGKDLFFVDSLVYKSASGLYRLKEKYTKGSPLFDVLQPSAKNFEGNLYVLINGATGSMGAVVASFLKGHERAKFIGEECGGAMEGPTSMGYGQLVLPNTRIRVEIPLTKSVHFLKYQKGRGVVPHYYIEPAIESLLSGVDDELNLALDLIGQSGGTSPKRKSPDRNPGRVLNPISYEKPDILISNQVPIAQTHAQSDFHRLAY